MTVIEYIQENPDCSREDISLALERSAASISNELSRLLWNRLIVRTGEKKQNDSVPRKQSAVWIQQS
ncbi:hypothetical protein OJO69_26775, partial [Escherichia coli]|nr:hypothetical protein [Escherichia coli]